MKFSKRFLTIALYSLGVTGSIYISITKLIKEGNTSVFVIFSFLALFIFVSEIIIDYIYKNKKLEINFDINDEVNEASEILNKFLLPFLLYISLLGYTYYNFAGTFVLFVYFIIYMSFLLLFLNIRAFFELDMKLQSDTNPVYDLIKFLIFYCFVDTLLNLYKSGTIEIVVFGIMYVVLFVLLSYLFIIRYVKNTAKIKKYLAVQNLIGATSLGLIFMLPDASALLLSLIAFFVFYVSLAIIHHVINKTLSFWVVFEYVLVFLMASSVLIGIG
jgi:hypothetical protein